MFPRVFRLDDFSMPTYGVLVSIGIILGLWVSERYAEDQGVDAHQIRNLGILAILSGIIGAKILAVLNSWSSYSSHPWDIFSVAMLRTGGVFLGGLISALIAAICYIRYKNMPALATADACAPGIALGHAVGRIGCFAAGCCWGKPTNTFWGIAFFDPLAHKWSGTPLGIPLVPTQLLESLVEFANLLFLMWLIKHHKKNGQVIGAYLFVYGAARFGLECLRDDPGRGSVLGGALSGTQLICILLITTGAFLSLRHEPQTSQP